MESLCRPRDYISQQPARKRLRRGGPGYKGSRTWPHRRGAAEPGGRMMPFSSAGGSEEAFDYLFKIIVIGDSNVGKTCVVHRFKSGLYHEKQQNTIGVDFTVRSLELDGKKVKIQVWDTAGQERFRTITQSYYRSAHGAILAYDLTRRSTFESIPHWIHEIEKYGAANLVLMLIGALTLGGNMLTRETLFQCRKAAACVSPLLLHRQEERGELVLESGWWEAGLFLPSLLSCSQKW
ncbi:ras-related protein Rab-19 isoform X3 [Emydura macquarii macquarii]|uniref:ras-related protein Rab-19 isoform X3 n=1 Tax=Emydura macquarii macquarii TaxID=1129001 RepID=UPI00352A90DE